MPNDRSTIYEVARRSGVSTATVSRAMHGGDGMSKATRERVLSVATDLEWVPDGRARGLATRSSGIVGVLFHDLDSTGLAEEESPLYVDNIIRGAERAATAAGDAVLIAATRGRSGRELAFWVSGKVDGLVVLARSVSRADIETLARTLPIVTVAARSRRTFDDVSVDNRGAMRVLADHLVAAHGYTDLAFVGGPPRSPDSIERFTGYQKALRSHDLPVPKAPDAYGGFTETGGRQAVAELLKQRVPRAIVCGNDEMAIGAYAVLREAKLRVPADVAVTGFDDIASARHIRPALTTVHQPMRDVGEQAVEILLARIASRDARRRSLVLPTEPRFRRSCGCMGRTTAPRPTSSASTPTPPRTPPKDRP